MLLSHNALFYNNKVVATLMWTILKLYQEGVYCTSQVGMSFSLFVFFLLNLYIIDIIFILIQILIISPGNG